MHSNSRVSGFFLFFGFFRLELLLLTCSHEADEIHTVQQAIDYISHQPDGRYKLQVLILDLFQLTCSCINITLRHNKIVNLFKLYACH